MDNIGSKKYKLNIFSINNGLKEDIIRTLLSKNCLAYRPCLKEIREIGRQLRKQPDKTNIIRFRCVEYPITDEKRNCRHSTHFM